MRQASPLPAPVDLKIERAQAALASELGRQAIVQPDPSTGTPRVVARPDGFLTAGSSAPAADIALGYVSAHQAAFGLDDGDLRALRLTRDYTSIDGTHHLRWAQLLNGIPTFGHGLIASVTADGRLVNLFGSPVPGLSARTAPTGVSAAAALGVAARNAGVGTLAPRASQARGAEHVTTFSDGSSARLVLVPLAPGDVHLGWQVSTRADSAHVYDYVIDAAGAGRILFRQNRVSGASGSAWDYAPHIEALGASRSGGSQTTRTFPASTATTKLQGTFAHVYTDVDDDDVPDVASAQCPECGEIPPSSAGAWKYTFKPFLAGGTGGSYCQSVFPQCSWNLATPYSWRTNLRQNAAQVYYLVNTFHDYLLAAPFGFTPAAGNFEGADAVNVEVMDGAATNSGLPDSGHADNANMSTAADGTPPRMQMYLTTHGSYGSRGVDQNAGDDAATVYHEYTHGMSHRLITDADGNPALTSFQALALGEAWSDWYAMDYLEGHGLNVDTSAASDVSYGIALTGGDVTYGHALRSQGMDCPVAPDAAAPCTAHGGFTFSDFGHVDSTLKGESHYDGEVWGETLWDLRRRLITDLGRAAGITRAESLVTRGMELTPPDPTLLDARNAILQADQVAGGTDSARIWAVFAHRGMGYFATTANGSDLHPHADYELPPAGAGTADVSGSVHDVQTGAMIPGALVGFPGHDSGFAGDFQATTAADGSYAIPGMPDGQYAVMRAAAPGYDVSELRDVTIQPGSNVIPHALTRDWASTAGSATVQSFTGVDSSFYKCGPGQAVDGSGGLGWETAAPSDPNSPGAKTLMIKLPTNVKVSGFALDPGAVCGDDPYSSLGSYAIAVSTSTTPSTFKTVRTGTFGSADNHRMNYLRPTATAGLTKVRYVLLTMNGTQSSAGTGASFMDVAEFSVRGSAVPTASSFTPTSGRTGTVVTVTGTNLRTARTATVGGLAAPLTPVSDTQVKVTVPDGAATGRIAITSPGGTATTTASYTVTLSMTGLSPATGPAGTVVTINGVGFNTSSRVKFKGVAATTTYVSPTQLTATIPSTAATGAGTLTVTNTAAPTGTVTGAGTYTKT